MKIISTEKAPQAVGPYSQAIVTNGMVYTSGQIALVPQTGEMITGDIKAQSKLVFQNLKAVLEAAGSSMDKIVKTTCYLTNMDNFAVFNELYSEFITHKPARSCVEASALPKGAIVEVEAIALVS